MLSHSPDWEPTVVNTDPTVGLSTWRCACGAASLGWFADAGNARGDFLRHKYGVPRASPASCRRKPPVDWVSLVPLIAGVLFALMMLGSAVWFLIV